MRSSSLAGVLCLALAGVEAAAAPRPPQVVLLASDAKQPALAIGGDGTVFAAFLRAGNVVVSVSKDRGRNFAEPVVAIDAKGRARGGRQRGPRIGVDGKGRLAVTSPVTFDEEEGRKRYPAPEVYLVTSPDGGAGWGAPVRVNEVEKKAPEGLHAMAVARDGTIHVAWLDRRDRGAKGQNLWYARVENGKVGANARVAEEVCECCAPGLALDATGNPVLAWREGGEKDSRELLVVRSTDGGRTFGKPGRLNRADSKEDG